MYNTLECYKTIFGKTCSYPVSYSKHRNAGDSTLHWFLRSTPTQKKRSLTCNNTVNTTTLFWLEITMGDFYHKIDIKKPKRNYYNVLLI